MDVARQRQTKLSAIQKLLENECSRAPLAKNNLYWGLSAEWWRNFKEYMAAFSLDSPTSPPFPPPLYCKTGQPHQNVFLPWSSWSLLARCFGAGSLTDTMPVSMWKDDKRSHALVTIAYMDPSGKVERHREVVVNRHQPVYLLMWQMLKEEEGREAVSTAHLEMWERKPARMLWCSTGEEGGELQVIENERHVLAHIIDEQRPSRMQRVKSPCVKLESYLHQCISNGVKVGEQLNRQGDSMGNNNVPQFNVTFILEVKDRNESAWPSGIQVNARRIYSLKNVFEIELQYSKEQLKGSCSNSEKDKCPSSTNYLMPYKSDTNIGIRPYSGVQETALQPDSGSLDTKDIELDAFCNNALQSLTERESELESREQKVNATENKLFERLLTCQTLEEASKEQMITFASKCKEHIEMLQDLKQKETDLMRKTEALSQREKELELREKGLPTKSVLVKDFSDKQAQKITLNVGGREFTTSRVTLCQHPQSLLTELFGDVSTPGVHCDKQPFFLDRDGDLFVWIIKYLRLGRDVVEVLPADRALLTELYLEAKFFRLNDLVDMLGRMLGK